MIRFATRKRFATSKEDGSIYHYVYESENTIKKDFNSDLHLEEEERILPDYRDAVIYFSINGLPLCVDTFLDILCLLGITTRGNI